MFPNLKKTVYFLVSVKHNNSYIFYFILTNIFRSIDDHQAFLTKFRLMFLYFE